METKTNFRCVQLGHRRATNTQFTTGQGSRKSYVEKCSRILAETWRVKQKINVFQSHRRGWLTRRLILVPASDTESLYKSNQEIMARKTFPRTNAYVCAFIQILRSLHKIINSTVLGDDLRFLEGSLLKLSGERAFEVAEGCFWTVSAFSGDVLPGPCSASSSLCTFRRLDVRRG